MGLREIPGNGSQGRWIAGMNMAWWRAGHMVRDDDMAVEMAAISMHYDNQGEVFAHAQIFERVQHDSYGFCEDGMPAQTGANLGIQHSLSAEPRRKAQHHVRIDLPGQLMALTSRPDVLEHLVCKIIRRQPAVCPPGEGALYQTAHKRRPCQPESCVHFGRSDLGIKHVAN